jgi:putative acetyltransferase
MPYQIRNADATDTPAILSTAVAAFGPAEGPEVADLITDLLADPSAQPIVSLVGIADDHVVGYILFTYAHVSSARPDLSAAILAPLAVHPDHQGCGLGGRLIRAGLDQLRAAGVALVFVLGHPGYYPKYGFAPAGTHGLFAPYPIPPEVADAWMVQELRPGVIGSVRGQVACADALNEPQHWRE